MGARNGDRRTEEELEFDRQVKGWAFTEQSRLKQKVERLEAESMVVPASRADTWEHIKGCADGIPF